VADGTTTTLVTIGVDRANSDIFYTVPARTVVVTNADNELSVPTITGPAATTALMRPTVTWTAIPGAASYEVRLVNVTTKQVLAASPGTNTFAPAADLGIGLYEVAVRAIMPGGLTHAWSIVRRFQVATAVTVPTLGDFITLRPTLRWNPLAGAVRYEVVVTNARNAVVAQAASVTGTAWTPPQNLAKGTYRLTIRGFDTAGRAALWSLPAAFQIK
jgi:hypothetical protein